MEGFIRFIEEGETWVAISFLLFVIFIAWKAWKPMMAALDRRAERIKEEIDEAQRLREEAQHLLAEYQRKQRDAVREAEEMLKAAQEEAKRIRHRAEEDLIEALKRRERQAMERIAQAEQQAQADVRNMAVDAAIAATRQILGENMDKKTADDLVDETIRTLPDKIN